MVIGLKFLMMPMMSMIFSYEGFLLCLSERYYRNEIVLLSLFRMYLVII